MSKVAVVDNDSKLIDKNGPSSNLVEEKLDNKKFGWFHVKIVIISGAGFFTDSYDLFSVGLVTS